MEALSKNLHGQPSYSIRSDAVGTRYPDSCRDGRPCHLPLGKKKVSPFSVAPWALNGEPLEKGLPPFFMPFVGTFFATRSAGNETPYRGEKHPPHGETANSRWSGRKLTSETAFTSFIFTFAQRCEPVL